MSGESGKSDSPTIVIYTKNWCGYCRAAKKVLDDMELSYEEIDVTHDDEQYQAMLSRAEGRHTVPQIFINDQGIGGYTELVQMIKQAQQKQE